MAVLPNGCQLCVARFVQDSTSGQSIASFRILEGVSTGHARREIMEQEGDNLAGAKFDLARSIAKIAWGKFS